VVHAAGEFAHTWPCSKKTRADPYKVIAIPVDPATNRLEAGAIIPTFALLDRISAAPDADLIVEIALHAAQVSTPADERATVPVDTPRRRAGCPADASAPAQPG
jgi:hypothetical protein